MKNKITYALSALAALLSSCSTDLTVIGKYKETMVVYGLLDQSQPKQYIKINKAFLGEGSALGFAQVRDSTQYVNSLNVVLKRIKNGVELATYNLAPDNTIPKASGIFYSMDQANAIYSFPSPAGTLSTDSDYQLIIKNNETGTAVSSQTSLLSDAIFTSPTSSSPFIGFILASNNKYQYQVKWLSGKNAKIYQMMIRLNYIDSLSTGNVLQKIDWAFPEQNTQGLNGGEEMKNEFLGQEFLQRIGSELSNSPGLIARRALNIDILLTAGGDDLNTFIEVNKPSTGINQEKPVYTNIKNGLGIFSSRFSKAPLSKPMNKTTWDSLACGQYTRGLKFLNSLGLVCP